MLTVDGMEIDEAALRSETEILHLIYHRNRNQFKRTKWWTQFSILHRRCWQLVELVETARDSDKLKSIVHFLNKKLIPSAYRSFHNVLAQGQFVTLGLAIIALLARIRHLLRPSDMNKKLTASMIETKMDVDVETTTPSSAGDVRALDMGETISRNEITKPVKSEAKRSKKRTSTDADDSVSSSKKKKKPKKKAKNEIDDIFGI
ncbi:hypothetical protein TRICI_000790 [Trichomonascus ciferrii]|uniref:RNase MRP protein 1 RNA binding domain-containing protein n=1 Tax=Trichomonascus ciferrii TaxID=44093 RepID=A0A642VB82_9ASCO|nr:hypothetical protein TRICI_000790 [Trichomonascus ciferrii]